MKFRTVEGSLRSFPLTRLYPYTTWFLPSDRRARERAMADWLRRCGHIVFLDTAECQLGQIGGLALNDPVNRHFPGRRT
jgi:hypothetical protein